MSVVCQVGPGVVFHNLHCRVEYLVDGIKTCVGIKAGNNF